MDGRSRKRKSKRAAHPDQYDRRNYQVVEDPRSFGDPWRDAPHSQHRNYRSSSIDRSRDFDSRREPSGSLKRARLVDQDRVESSRRSSGILDYREDRGPLSYDDLPPRRSGSESWRPPYRDVLADDKSNRLTRAYSAPYPHKALDIPTKAPAILRPQTSARECPDIRGSEPITNKLAGSNIKNASTVLASTTALVPSTGENSGFSMLFCTNLNIKTEIYHLEDKFRRFEGRGKIYFRPIRKDVDEKSACLEFSSIDGAQTAMDRMQGYRILGNPISLDFYHRPRKTSNDPIGSDGEEETLAEKIARSMSDDELIRLWTARIDDIDKLDALFNRKKDLAPRHQRFYDEGTRLAGLFPKDRPIQGVARRYDLAFTYFFHNLSKIVDRRVSFPSYTDLIWRASDSHTRVSDRDSIRLSMMGLHECLKDIEYLDTVYYKLLGPGISGSSNQEGFQLYEVRQVRNDLAHYVTGMLQWTLNYRGLHNFMNIGVDDLNTYVKELKNDADHRINVVRRYAKTQKKFLTWIGIGDGVWVDNENKGQGSEGADEGEMSDPDEM